MSPGRVLPRTRSSLPSRRTSLPRRARGPVLEVLEPLVLGQARPGDGPMRRHPGPNRLVAPHPAAGSRAAGARALRRPHADPRCAIARLPDELSRTADEGSAERCVVGPPRAPLSSSASAPNDPALLGKRALSREIDLFFDASRRLLPGRRRPLVGYSVAGRVAGIATIVRAEPALPQPVSSQLRAGRPCEAYGLQAVRSVFLTRRLAPISSSGPSTAGTHRRRPGDRDL